METIKNILEGIWNAITSVWDVLTTIIKGIIDAFKYLWMVIDQLNQAISQLPDILKVYGGITITIIIILFVTNRTGGKSNA